MEHLGGHRVLYRGMAIRIAWHVLVSTNSAYIALLPFDAVPADAKAGTSRLIMG